MAAREEEEFELVLGNKQLLSLFFLVVVLFGVFFSFGYTVGFNRGENSPTRDVASVEPLEEPSKKVQLPEALLQEPPRPSDPDPSRSEKAEAVVSTTARQEPPTQATPPPVVRTTPPKETPKPRPVPQAAKVDPPPATKTSAPSRTTPAAAPPAAKTSTPAQQPSSGQEVTNSTHIQVSAVQVKKDAEVFVEQLRAKGHPTALSDKGDGWYRVVVGPFSSDAEAQAYQKLLAQQGLSDTIVRKR